MPAFSLRSFLVPYSYAGVLGLACANNASDDTTAYFSALYTIMSLRRGAKKKQKRGVCFPSCLHNERGDGVW